MKCIILTEKKGLYLNIAKIDRVKSFYEVQINNYEGAYYSSMTKGSFNTVHKLNQFIINNLYF